MNPPFFPKDRVSLEPNSYSIYERYNIYIIDINIYIYSEGFLISDGIILENVANITIKNVLNDVMYDLVFLKKNGQKER